MNIHEAVEHGDIERIRELLRNGADVNARNSGGSTPLHKAKDVDIARLLLDHGADVHARIRIGYTPLIVAYNEDIAALLLERGADPNATDRDGNTVLHLAKTADRVRLLANYGADPNRVNNIGNMPLHSTFAKALLLMSGPTYEYPLITKAYIDIGADVNARNRKGLTPLHLAVFFHRHECINVLMNAGVATNIRELNGITPLRMAMLYVRSHRLNETRRQLYTETARLLATKIIKRKWHRFYERRVRAARAIQAAWERCAYNRMYALCRRRMDRTYAIMRNDD